MDYQKAYEKLEKYGQLQILKYYDELTQEQKEALIAQIMETDLEVVSACAHKETLNVKGDITPLASMQVYEIAKKKEEYQNIGKEAIKAGKIGAVLLAGGIQRGCRVSC